MLQNQDVQVELAGAKKINVEVSKLVRLTDSNFAVEKQEINGIVYPVFTNLPNNLSEMYNNVAQEHGDKEFLIYQSERYSFNDLNQKADDFAVALLTEYNIKKGDMVVIAMRNYPEWIVAFMAITKLGAIVVPLNAWWQLDEFEFGITHCNAKLVIADQKRLNLLNDFLSQKSIPVILARKEEESNNVSLLGDLLLKYKNSVLFEIEIKPEDAATIFYTSGSTGEPKGAESNQRSILSALNTWTLLGTGAAFANGTAGKEPAFRPCALMTVPLFHVTGCHVLFLLSFFTGRKTVMMHKWDAKEALTLIEQERVTYFNGVPTMSMEMMQHPLVSEFDTSSLTDISAGGAARPSEHVRKLYDTFPEGHASTGYGLTETNALGAVNHSGDYLGRPNSVGTATFPIVDIIIIDQYGNKLKTGEHGEIAIKSISNMVSYFKNEQATEQVFIDGYFRTGDLGYLDEDGFVFIVDRVKDIIIRGGENISCLEVEEAIYKCGLVQECSVFALPDERLGEIVGAAIYPKSGAKICINELQSFLSNHLASFKVPSKVFITENALPRLGSGKLNKKQMKIDFYC
ncbi:class I adenylate-forming enzyme family protein [Shewanella sp. ULN5]|uniref:class I adenylate-forming enzyme family protein n=1 Tax=Shewanella sp. ULN5 TaxID=2994678 RepID=UPI0027401CED|nr:class I adenylate-forming enzyme family protein [Shewanella sp. ULN5]MDP5148238.1 class I adenylate-forming enzyme family protein [Shewanella sp. ULN5]